MLLEFLIIPDIFAKKKSLFLQKTDQDSSTWMNNYSNKQDERKRSLYRKQE
jgi:hypothetical protein